MAAARVQAVTRVTLPWAVAVAGPTCGGKSALALDLAERLGGTVINADSMQVYRELRVMTARPTPEDEARVPHALYGVQPAAEAASVAWWRERALDAMRVAAEAGRLPILCGGTGLYFQALTEGLSPIPDPGPEARAEARALLAEAGAAALHARLALHDPATAATLRPSDGQRVARAWEVWRGTGVGLAAWHARRSRQTLEWRLCALQLDPPRDVLRAAIAARFAAMLAAGRAWTEVRGSPRPESGSRLCPPCGRTASPNSPPISAATITLAEAERLRTTARHRPVHQAPGHLVPPSRHPQPTAANA